MEEEKEENIIELRKKFEYNPIDHHCPMCGHFPLEEETTGYEKNIFCTNCDYVQTQSL